MSISGKGSLTQQLQPPAVQQNGGRRSKQPSFGAIVNTSNLGTSLESSIDNELFGPIASDAGMLGQKVASTNSGMTTAGAGNKAAMQKLASSFVALNKRKAEKRERDVETWKTLIQSALDLQKGKIPLLLAVEAGNQSMCRELLSSQTADQLKVSKRSQILVLILHS